MISVQFTHAGDDGLVGFFVSTYAERRVFLSQTAQCRAHFLLGSALVFGSTAMEITGSGNSIRPDDRRVLVTQGITGGDVLQTDCRGDVTRANFFDLFTLVGVHLNDTAETLTCRLHGVQYGITRVNHTGVYAEEGQVTHERVGGDFERQRRERLVVVRVTLSRGIFTVVGIPLIAGTSVGDGRYSMTASSIACTPLFLNAEPQVTG